MGGWCCDDARQAYGRLADAGSQWPVVRQRDGLRSFYRSYGSVDDHLIEREKLDIAVLLRQSLAVFESWNAPMRRISEVAGVGEPWFWNSICTTSVAGMPWRRRPDRQPRQSAKLDTHAAHDLFEDRFKQSCLAVLQEALGARVLLSHSEPRRMESAVEEGWRLRYKTSHRPHC